MRVPTGPRGRLKETSKCLSITIAKPTARWRTGRTDAGRTLKCLRAQSTRKRLGAGARLAHHGPAPHSGAVVRGRIYVCSRHGRQNTGGLQWGGVHIRTLHLHSQSTQPEAITRCHLPVVAKPRVAPSPFSGAIARGIYRMLISDLAVKADPVGEHRCGADCRLNASCLLR